jgi:hypothetical protein
MDYVSLSRSVIAVPLKLARKLHMSIHCHRMHRAAPSAILSMGPLGLTRKPTPRKNCFLPNEPSILLNLKDRLAKRPKISHQITPFLLHSRPEKLNSATRTHRPSP